MRLRNFNCGSAANNLQITHENGDVVLSGGVSHLTEENKGVVNWTAWSVFLACVEIDWTVFKH